LIQFLELHPYNEHRIFKHVLLPRDEPDVPIPPVQQQQALLPFVEERRRQDRHVVEPRRLSMNGRDRFEYLP